MNWSYDKAGEEIETIKSNFNTDSFYKSYSFSDLLSTIDKWLIFFKNNKKCHLIIIQRLWET